MEFRGVPLHPLVIHAVVALVPLAAFSALLFAVPRWRWLARWPAVVFAVLGALATQLVVMSGRSLETQRHLETLPLVRTHALWGHRLQVAMWLFAALMLVAFWVMPHVTRITGARDRVGRAAVLEKPLTVIVPIAAVVVLVLVVVTGDAGARAVWQK